MNTLLEKIKTTANSTETICLGEALDMFCSMGFDLDNSFKGENLVFAEQFIKPSDIIVLKKDNTKRIVRKVAFNTIETYPTDSIDMAIKYEFGVLQYSPEVYDVSEIKN